MVFPLFNLPLLAILVVLKRMDVIELASLSVTSSKVQRVAKRHTKSRTITVEIFYGSLEFVKFGTNNEGLAEWKQDRDTETDLVKRIKNKITFLADTFKIGSSTCHLMYNDAESCCEILEFARDQGIRFEKVIWSGSIGSEELVNRFLELLKDVVTLDISIKCNAPDYNYNSRLMNRFLKNWMQGTAGRIEELKVNGVQHWAPQVVLYQIENENIVADEKWRIQREDGTRATVYIEYINFEFNVLSD